MSETDVQYCPNCKREVPSGNFTMHIVHCQRNLALCTKCDEPIPQSELAAHNANLHSFTECPDCGTRLEKRHLAEHKNSSCSRREICCTFCHIEVEAAELAEHENYCGSRTERCDDCGEFVMLKYQQLHQDSNHGFLKLDDEPGPVPSWSSRTTSNVLNDLGRQRKVSNASQDSGRPTAASNRLSPSKRTNDMPQVNSSTVFSAPKALNKPSIPQDQNEVDLDLLLALRLAEQEHSFSAPTAPPESENSSFELVALPCEFCQAMIPANQLVLHETGCEPELARYIAPVCTVQKNKTLPEPQNDGLPCEFCGALFPPNSLLQHQDACENDLLSSDNHLVNRFKWTRPKFDSKKLLKLSNDEELYPIKRQSSPTNGDIDDRNPYLSEFQAALRKPVLNVPSVDVSQPTDFSSSNQHNLTSYVNGYSLRNESTGAVPKQKAGKRANIREISEEVSRSSSSSSTIMQPPHHGSGTR